MFRKSHMATLPRSANLRPIFLLLLSMTVLPLLPNSARATITEVFGGPGGGRFSLVCDPGHFLVGFHARAGGWVDGIGLICAPYDAMIRKAGSGRRKGHAGGRGGTEQEVYCAPGEAVTGFGLAHTRGGGLPRQFVNTVDIFCQHRGERTGCISSGEGCGAILSKSKGLGSFGSANYKYDRPNCPSNELATGIQGRSGIYIDAIGLICGPKPAAAPASSPSAGGFKKPPIRELGKRKPAIKKLGKRTVEVTANNDVDIYNGAGGQFQIIGMMREGTAATLLERHPDGWLRLKLSVPGGSGWVAEDHLTVR